MSLGQEFHDIVTANNDNKPKSSDAEKSLEVEQVSIETSESISGTVSWCMSQDGGSI